MLVVHLCTRIIVTSVIGEEYDLIPCEYHCRVLKSYFEMQWLAEFSCDSFPLSSHSADGLEICDLAKLHTIMLRLTGLLTNSVKLSY